MNRQIKFRGWNPKRGMSRVYTLYEMLVEKIDNNGLDRLWLQSTGLLDRNGKEIYEGDIVQTETSTGVHVFCVRYDVSSASYMCPSVVDEECTTTIGQLPNSIEIIGNIYQNKDLLK